MLVASGLYYVYHKGEQNIQEKWDMEKKEAKIEIDRLNIAAQKVTLKTKILYIDRVKTITVKGDTITRYVDKFITADSDAKCIIPKNFVLLHDSAALNTVPDESPVILHGATP